MHPGFYCTAMVLQTGVPFALKHIMAQMPTPRYFWVDVLCVDLDDAAMRRAETAKQAVPFGNAKGRHLVLEKTTHILSMLWHTYIISLGST